MPRISWSTRDYIHQTTTSKLFEYACLLNLLFLHPCLEYDKNEEETTDKLKGEEVDYGEADLTAGEASME
jgi:hypothetical protein